jgi:hypothetical protein
MPIAGSEGTSASLSWHKLTSQLDMADSVRSKRAAAEAVRSPKHPLRHHALVDCPQ